MLVYVVGFGMPVYVAVLYLSSAHVRELAHTRSGWSISGIIELSLTAVAALAAVVLLAREAPSWSKPTGPGARWSAELKTFGLGWSAMAAGGITAALLGTPDYPESHAAASAWPSAISSLLAGPTEEIVVLVVPLVFLRAARWSWWQVIPAALALRLAYHVYYGYPAAGLAVWALAVIFIYLRSHAVVGLIAAHSYWDLSITVGWYWDHALSDVMMAVPFLALIVWGLVSLILWLVHRHERKVAARRAASGVGWYQNSTGHWWWWDGQNWFPQTPPYGGA